MAGLAEMTAAELVALHDSRCLAGDRIGRAWKRPKAELVSMIEALGDTAPDTTETEATESADTQERVTVGATVRRLLIETDLEYAEIVRRTIEAHPEARTTTRSVASVAAVLRKGGADVPQRRRAKTP